MVNSPASIRLKIISRPAEKQGGLGTGADVSDFR